MEDEKSKTLNKWSIRLLACYFCIWAITDVYQLITGTKEARGFMFFDLGLTVNGKYVDVIAWIGVCILLYTGVQLIRFDSRGRDWALLILWIYSIASGVLFIVSLAALPSSDFMGSIFGATILGALVIGITFAFYLFLLFVLQRKGSKTLFQNSSEVGKGS